MLLTLLQITTLCNLLDLPVNLFLYLQEPHFPDLFPHPLVLFLLVPHLLTELLNLYLLRCAYVRKCTHLLTDYGQLTLQVFHFVHAFELEVLAHQREGLDGLLVLVPLRPELKLEHLHAVLQVGDLVLLEVELREPLRLSLGV